MTLCRRCNADLRFLRRKRRPAYEKLTPSIRVADLFAGGGGLSLGVAEGARRIGLGTIIALAVENDPDLADVYASNFPRAHLDRGDVAGLFDGGLGSGISSRESSTRRLVGPLDILVAGPPCQGHSDLNNHTRRRDPRNRLYLRAVRAAEVLEPTFVVLENVPAIERDDAGVIDAAIGALEAAGYAVARAVLDLTTFGVPQRRKRHILLGSRAGSVDPAAVLAQGFACASHARTVAWAIRDLEVTGSGAGRDSSSMPTAANRKRMEWLLANDQYDLPNDRRPPCHHGSHTYLSMYGRLRWDSPAQTITTGFGSMGQGRFVHPSQARTVTPHEAARLQTLPDFFDLNDHKSRHVWATVIGNAVPPLLTAHLLSPVMRTFLARTTRRRSRRVSTDPSSRRDVAVVAAASRNGHRRGVPPSSSETIRTRMQTTKRRDTGPELALRSELHRLGMRYFVDRVVEGSRRRADIVFPRYRVAVYVDGCFWHGCPEHGTVPKANRSWWLEKFEQNRRRDADTDHRLREAGWVVLRFWAHEDPRGAAREVLRTVRRRRPAAPLPRTRVS